MGILKDGCAVIRGILDGRLKTEVPDACIVGINTAGLSTWV